MCTLKATRNENTPGINTADAWLGVLGYSLLPVPNPETLSAELRADLEALADKHGVDGDLRTELIAACVGRHPHNAKSWQTAREKLAEVRALSADRKEREAAEAELRRFTQGRERYAKVKAAQQASRFAA